jgi:tRNA (guanine-N7-)-methyltransferase
VSVRRARRLPLEELAPYLFESPTTPAFIDWSAVFGNANSVEVEVGFGKGLFLLTAALARSDVNFLGVEILRKYQLFTATRLAKRGLRQVRLAKGDARLFFRDYVATGSVQAVHAYFPDPWWKKRHHKRRLFTPEFVAQCERVLAAGGHLHVMTDVEAYFQIISALVAQQPGLKPVPPADETSPSDYRTNFERKSRMAGRPVHGMSWRRTVASSGQAAGT